ncbi:S9 family peptidase [Pedobacter agri]|uniref:S9 family peptidase n=1 Tax=Pedobacter agri TaxID=454586 RepID=UPI00292D57A6|nr:S9 family peptidase [Pedobacter agri]
MLNIKIHSIVIIAVLFSYQLAIAQNSADRIQVTDLLKIKRASNIKVNPEGSFAFFNVSTLDTSKSKDGFSNKSKWYQIDLAHGNTVTEFKTFGDGANQLNFSPNGKQVAFVKNVKGKSQIFLWNVGASDIKQLTDQKYGANSPVWSQKGDKIVFTSSVSLTDLISDADLNPNSEKPVWLNHPGHDFAWVASKNIKADANGTPEQIRAYLDKDGQAKKVKVFTRLQFQTETSTSNEIRFSHLYIIDVEAGSKAKQLTSGFNSYSSALFKDEKTLYANAKINNKHPDEELFQSIIKIDLPSGKQSSLLQNDNISYSLEAISYSGKWLIHQTSVPGTVNVPVLYVKNTLGGTDAKIDIDRTSDNFSFTKDEKSLYFTVASNGGSVVVKTSLHDGKITRLSEPNFGINDLAVIGNKALFVGANYQNPSEIYLSDLELNKPQSITKINTDWLSTKKLSKPEKQTFVNDKGLTVEFWVMKPTDFDQGKKYPLLLEIHGGPASMYGPGDASMWHEFQYFAAQGIGVVYGNPRGSSGYGQKFLEANKQDWAYGPTNDVLKSVDITLKEGWADSEKLLISGGSYGGYLTSWIIAHHQRFLAASSQRGVYDFKTMFGEGNVWRIIPRYYGVLPWGKQDEDILTKQSPFTYVANINTPLLIFAGENDGRVGYSQSDMLYKALKVLHKPVEYVRQGGASHEMVRSGDPGQRIDQMLRTYEFFSRYLNPITN